MKILKLIWLPIVAATLALIVYGSINVSNAQLNQKKLENKIAGLETKISQLESQIQNQGKILGTTTSTQTSAPQPKCPEIKFSTNRYLKDSGDDISALQCLLGMEQSGQFDLKTKDALIDFQIKNNIVPSKTAYGAGYFGPRTRKFINEGVLVPYHEPVIATTASPVLEETPSEPTPTSTEPIPPVQPTPPPPPPEIPKKKATVQIAQIGNFQVELQDNDTAFSILLRAGQENNFQVSYTEYPGMGAFVDCIGTICGQNFGAHGTYWAFYYNGVYSQVGASLQPVSENDITSWKFESW